MIMDEFEKWLGRELTSTEKLVLEEKGEDWFMEHWLGFDEDDIHTFERLKALITAYCVGTVESFEDEAKKDNGSAYMVLRTIADYIAPTRECITEEDEHPVAPVSPDMGMDVILKDLKDGRTLNLTDREFEDVANKLSKTCSSYRIVNDNGKVSLYLPNVKDEDFDD